MRLTASREIGRAVWHLRPAQGRLLARLKALSGLFANETTAPVPDPGRGQTKTGEIFAYARDDRSWGGTDPPGVAYVYAPDRTAARPIEHFSGFAVVLQMDDHTGYRALTSGNQVTLAFWRSHVRRFYEEAVADAAPVASGELTQIAALYRIGCELHGVNAAGRDRARQTKSRCEADAARSPERQSGSSPMTSRLLDDLAAHKVAGIRDANRTADVSLLDLPPYSPDLHPSKNIATT
jgi:hypothetical protein